MDGFTESWTTNELVPAARLQGIDISAPAIRVIEMVVTAQIEEGLVADRAKLYELLSQLPASRIIDLYIVKYGNRKLTVNRAVRLLADLHDRWVLIRSILLSRQLTGEVDNVKVLDRL